MFDICLINPPTTLPTDPYPYFPLSLVTLGGMLKKYNFSTKIIDFDLIMRREGWTCEQFLTAQRRYLETIDAKVFGITTICSNYAISVLLTNLIKEIHPSSKVIFGGPQASLVPLETLDAFSTIDLIICGEGEITLIELLKSDFSIDELQKIAGLAIRVKGRPILTAKRSFVTNLDDLPPPDFDLLPPNEYHGQDFLNDENLYANIIEAGRGCPFKCTFCATSLMWSHKFRVKSPKRIINEMKNLHDNYGFSRVNLIHDNFTTNPKFLTHFCYQYQIDNPSILWRASSNVNCMNENQLKSMAESGCCNIFFGVESASPRIQQVINKKLDLKNFTRLLNQCDKLGITTVSAFMIGFPEETIEDLNLSFSTALEYRHTGSRNFVVFNKPAALAGTRIYKDNFSHLIKPKSTSLYQGGVFSDIIPDIPEVWELTLNYPHLFSWAYDIPNHNISEDIISGLILFFRTGAWYFPNATYKLIHSIGYKPLTLWKEWHLWCTENYGKLPDNTEEALNYFPLFLQTIDLKLKISNPPTSYPSNCMIPPENAQ